MPQERQQIKVGVQNNQILILGQSENALPVSLLIPNHELLSVRINGQKVERRVSVREDTQIDVSLLNKSAEKSAKFHISADLLRAALVIEYHPGLKITLHDAEPSTFLELRVTEEIIPPERYTNEEIVNLIKGQKLTGPIDWGAIIALLASGASGECVFLEGVAPIEGIEEHFAVTLKEPKREEAFGIKYIRPILTVRSDTELAIHVAEVPGVPGMDVFGHVISPRPIKKLTQKLGKGVIESDERKVISTRGGRFVNTTKLLDVAEILEFDSNLEAAEGLVQFDGDILVHGDVLDGVEIEAGGHVQVDGHVSHAKITCDGAIVIKGGVFQSTIQAGTRSMALLHLQTLLKELQVRFQTFLNAIEQLKNALGNKTNSVPLNRMTTSLLTENKFGDLLEWSVTLQNWIRTFGSSISAIWINWMEQLSAEFTIARLETVRDLEYWKQLLNQLDKKIESIPSVQASEADIQVRNGQNSQLQCTGSVLASGQGFYQCTVKAGRAIIVNGTPGMILGSVIESELFVQAKEIGSRAEVPTFITVRASKGEIQASCVHPGTILAAGSWNQKVLKEIIDFKWP